MTVQYTHVTSFNIGDIVTMTFSCGRNEKYVIKSNDLFEPYYGENEKTKSNMHPNKQRAQSKINGKNSRWC